MINKQTIVEEGYLELYLLEELSAKEKLRVEEILTNDSQLQQMYLELQNGLESLSQKNAIEPKAKVKKEILAKIKSQSNQTNTLQTRTNHNLLQRIANIAAVVFLFASAFLWFQLSQANQSIGSLKNQNQELNNALADLKDISQKNNQYLNFINNSQTQKYSIKGNQKSPSLLVFSYVNKTQKKVIVSIQDLPPSKGQDYQMWADVDGEMIDMGILPQNQKILEMKHIANADSYNLTLEPKGGSLLPTVDNLVGNVVL